MTKLILLDAGLHFVGHCQTPLLVIDQPVEAATSLINYAAKLIWHPADAMYPGVRALVPPDYFWQLYDNISSSLSKIYGLKESEPEQVFCCYSIATTPPEKLTPLQSVPHFDSTSGKQLAMVQYLCDEHYGGTGFFRHNATGLENISNADLALYQTIAAVGLTQVTPSYANTNTPGYSLIAMVPAKKGRIVFYPASLLHSGLIAADTPLSNNPMTGRLTITGFMQFNQTLSW